jgi:uncharacterized membrane protein
LSEERGVHPGGLFRKEVSSEQVAVSGGFGFLTIVWLVLAVFLVIALWKVFTKAGQPGCHVLI